MVYVNKAGERHRFKALSGFLEITFGDQLFRFPETLIYPVDESAGFVSGTGIVKTQAGLKVLKVDLSLDASRWPTTLPPGQRGRMAEHVACLAHFEMAQFNRTTLAKPTDSARQNLAAKMLFLGNSAEPENQRRQVRKKINLVTAEFVKQKLSLLVFAGDDSGQGRLFVAFEGRAIEHLIGIKRGELLEIDAAGWVCQWGDRQATYSTFTLKSL